MGLASKYEHSEVAVIGRGVESVLRRLVRFLVGKISLVKLRELIDVLYVEELEEKFRSEHPDGRVSLALMALNTGLDTRMIHRIRNHPGYRRSLVEESEFFHTVSPAASLLHLWSTDLRFIDEDSGRPKPLAITGGGASVEALAKTLKIPRGVTINSIIELLEHSESIRVDRDKGLATLRSSQYLPPPDKDREGALEIGFVSISRLIDTVMANLESSSTDDRLLQRQYWIYQVPPHKLESLRAEGRQALENSKQRVCEVLAKYDQTFESPNQVSVGFGLYWFEDSESVETS